MNIRRITSLTALLSFILLILNSIVLYIVPQGRVAYWADWRLWGLSKTEWGDQHIIIGVLFLIAIFLHIYYNWKSILSYLKNRAKQLKFFTREFNIALLVTIFCTLGAYFTLPPFNWILEFGESIKDAAAVKYGEPPYGHAELSSLKGFIRRNRLDLSESVTRLKKAGIMFENEKQTLKEIARLNDISPQQVFLAMKPPEKTGSPKQIPDAPVSGIGKRSLSDICTAYDLNITTIMKGLVENNIRATDNMNLKEIADQNNMGPADIYDLIKRIADYGKTPAPEKGKSTVTNKGNPRTGSPTGLGRLTLSEVCKNYDIDHAEALKKLSSRGITAQPDDKIKKIAAANDMLPIDIYEIIK